jgi:hypothetical protein
MAQTNVQAFSGDVEISSNLAVDTNTLFVDSVGNKVGMGVTTPDGPLHISKSAPYNGDTGPGIIFTRYSNTYGGCIWNESNNDIDGLYFNAFNNTAASTAYGATPKMVINSNGNVGIGTNNPNQGNLTVYALGADPYFYGQSNGTYADATDFTGLGHFKSSGSHGAIRVSNNSDANGTTRFDFNTRLGGYWQTNSVVNSFFRGTAPAAGRIMVTGETADNYEDASMTFWTCRDGYDTGSRFDGIGGTGSLRERMRITSQGNVGIGTASPVGTLDVFGGSASNDSLMYVRNTANANTDKGAGIIFENMSGSSRFGLGRILALRENSVGSFNSYLSFHPTVNGTGFEAMRIDSSGRVGIGATNPGSKLDIRAGSSFVYIQGPNQGNSGGPNNDPWRGLMFTRLGTNGETYNGNVSLYTYRWKTSGQDPAMALRFNLSDTAPYNTNDVMTIRSDNKVGIATTNPTTQLHIKQGADDSTAHGIKIERSSSGAWHIYSGAFLDLVFNCTSGGYGYMQSATNVGQIDFTGQHRSFIDGVPVTKYNDFEGLIVSANKNKYYNIDKKLKTGLEAIQISESLPLVSISNVEKDKACFGVISGSEDPETRKYEQGMYVTVVDKQLGDTRAYINSVGEGAIWVVNTNGSLESGDYITTSNVMGYGQKQDDDILHNYTVAKITMDCDFNPVTQPVEIMKQEMGEVNYWVRTNYENVSEEDYSNLTSENRTTKIETYYSNENGEISAETYNTLEPHVQSTYTELTRTIYQKITKEVSKTEQEGYELEVRNEPVNVLDEHGQIQWEDHPTETEKAYKIRYLDADGNITDEANHVYKAAFVGCTYHCG